MPRYRLIQTLDAPITYTAEIEARNPSDALKQFLDMHNQDLTVEVGDPHEGSEGDVNITRMDTPA